MDNLLEYTRELPPSAAGRVFPDGEPILTAYDCVLCERETSRGYVYTAVNLITNKIEILSRRVNPLTMSGAAAMVEKIRTSKVAGKGRLQADRQTGDYISLEAARSIMNAVFAEVMPSNGFALRNEQIDLANHILNTLAKRGATLAEAETGTGKTHGYLVPAIIAKRGRLNDYWNTALYPDMQYAEMSKLPIVIATSSIALQRALLTEYIPQLSKILESAGVIKKPLTAILRKGREHYICRSRLKTYLATVGKITEREMMKTLMYSAFDLAEVEGLTQQVKRKISVEGRCPEVCPHKEKCEYIAFREETQSLAIDIQVCNHNYLLADTLQRAKGSQPLIPNYQTLVVDEAHKFLSAARTMYGAELADTAAKELSKKANAVKYRRKGVQAAVQQTTSQLITESQKLFAGLSETEKQDEDDSDHCGVSIMPNKARRIRNIRSIADRLREHLRDELFLIKTEELLAWVNKKHHADVTGIKVNRLLDNAADMKTRVVAVHNAIRDLEEIRLAVATERMSFKHGKTGYNTERQALRSFKSKIMDAIWQRSRLLFKQDKAAGKQSEQISRLIWRVMELREQADALANPDELICWLETDRDESRLCAIPKNIGARLFKDQWNKGISTILTSGTMSAAGDFSRTKQALGLDHLGGRVTETSKQSPFNYRDNAMLYIPENIPFPNNRNDGYIKAVAAEVEKLITASHGHAAVLFTSYKVMDKVWEIVESRKLGLPMFRLDKGGVLEIEKFKESRNGVLFASSVFSEGIDIPGDLLSMLIIVKLPFPQPDPISEYERTLYPDFGAYFDSVIFPDMVIRLRQQFGRLLRTETDTGCVAIIDCRISINGRFRERTLYALPDCPVTNDISVLINFLRSVKPLEYWN